jgi:hypothetical protein
LAETAGHPGVVVEAVLTAVARQVSRGAVDDLRVPALQPGMVIHGDMGTSTGLILVREGERVPDALIARLSDFAATVGICEPLPSGSRTDLADRTQTSVGGRVSRTSTTTQGVRTGRFCDAA